MALCVGWQPGTPDSTDTDCSHAWYTLLSPTPTTLLAHYSTTLSSSRALLTNSTCETLLIISDYRLSCFFYRTLIAAGKDVRGQGNAKTNSRGRSRPEERKKKEPTGPHKSRVYGVISKGGRGSTPPRPHAQHRPHARHVLADSLLYSTCGVPVILLKDYRENDIVHDGYRQEQHEENQLKTERSLFTVSTRARVVRTDEDDRPPRCVPPFPRIPVLTSSTLSSQKPLLTFSHRYTLHSSRTFFCLVDDGRSLSPETQGTSSFRNF
ncbi:hypothetical protein J6590_021005 [Homalodisca vitripennis]|nr:hypothetical protein J6590_021005 [Homalodisca vitripennis]